MSPEISLIGTRTASSTLGRRFTAGVIGGLSGGMVFGMTSIFLSWGT